jgi:hypothetical protein
MLHPMDPGGIEAIGEAVSGGLAARALEPDAGEGKASDNAACLNCGTALLGPHCHRCGQPAHVHRSLKAFWHDLAHGVLHFEGKIWRTLPLLAWRPGDLTRRYIEGQRARFVSPIALFLFSVFLMFAVIHAVGGPNFDGSKEGGAGQAQKRAQLEQALKRTEAERAKAAAEGLPTGAQDLAIKGMRDELGRVEPAGAAEKGPAAANVHSKLELGWFDTAYQKAKGNPELLIYKLQTNAYKFSWALIPISVPFLWLLFLHRRRYWRYGAYDHIVFITYSLSFMTLMVVVFTLLGAVLGSNDLAVIGITLVPPVHIFRQLRGAYTLSRLSALWRTFLLCLFGFLCLGLFLLMLVGIGAMD